MNHEVTRIWANNISDEPEGAGQRDFWSCTCGWVSSRVFDGGEREMRDHVTQNCPMCQRIRIEHKGFGPPHWASPRCQSGSYEHCSCDTCF